MADNLTTAQRRRAMASVRSVNTTPEYVVRRVLHELGYRFRLHRRDLPGTPDILLPSRRAAIFVHGCFWHQHRCKRGRRLPKSNSVYWTAKLQRNIARDRRTRARLKRLGWRVLVVWECQTHIQRREQLRTTLSTFLEADSRTR